MPKGKNLGTQYFYVKPEGFADEFVPLILQEDFQRAIRLCKVKRDTPCGI
jgi:hypothetical protein